MASQAALNTAARARKRPTLSKPMARGPMGGRMIQAKPMPGADVRGARGGPAPMKPDQQPPTIDVKPKLDTGGIVSDPAVSMKPAPAPGSGPIMAPSLTPDAFKGGLAELLPPKLREAVAMGRRDPMEAFQTRMGNDANFAAQMQQRGMGGGGIVNEKQFPEISAGADGGGPMVEPPQANFQTFPGRPMQGPGGPPPPMPGMGIDPSGANPATMGRGMPPGMDPNQLRSMLPPALQGGMGGPGGPGLQSMNFMGQVPGMQAGMPQQPGAQTPPGVMGAQINTMQRQQIPPNAMGRNATY